MNIMVQISGTPEEIGDMYTRLLPGFTPEHRATYGDGLNPGQFSCFFLLHPRVEPLENLPSEDIPEFIAECVKKMTAEPFKYVSLYDK